MSNYETIISECVYVCVCVGVCTLIQIILSVVQNPAVPLLNVQVEEAVFVCLGMKSPQSTFLLMVPMAVLVSSLGLSSV